MSWMCATELSICNECMKIQWIYGPSALSISFFCSHRNFVCFGDGKLDQWLPIAPIGNGCCRNSNPEFELTRSLWRNRVLECGSFVPMFTNRLKWKARAKRKKTDCSENRSRSARWIIRIRLQFFPRFLVFRCFTFGNNFNYSTPAAVWPTLGRPNNF